MLNVDFEFIAQGFGAGVFDAGDFDLFAVPAGDIDGAIPVFKSEYRAGFQGVTEAKVLLKLFVVEAIEFDVAAAEGESYGEDG